MTQKKLDSVVEKAKTAEVSDEYGPGNERWDMRPLSELIEPVLGKTPKRSEDEYWGGDIQWASAKDISQSETRHIYDTAENMTEAGKEASNAKILPEGTVVVVARGSVGEIIQLGEPMTFNQSCYALDTNAELLDDYLYYAWQYVFGQVQAVSYGTVFDTITMKSFEDIEIPVPPLDQQKLIARFLTSLDDMVECNYRVESTAQSIGQELFHAIMNDSPVETFGNIDYDLVRIRDIGDVITGGTPSTKNEEFYGGSTPFITAANLDDDVYPSKPEKELTQGGVSEVKNKQLRPGAVLVSCIGNGLGKTGVTMEACVVNQQINAVIPNDTFGSWYTYFLLSSIQHRLQQYASGSAQPIISKSSFSDVEVQVADKNARKKFNNLMKSLFQNVKIRRENSRTLSQIRDVLLPKLISGRVNL